MSFLQFLVPFEWIEVIGPILPFAILTLGVANLVTRFLAHRNHVQQAETAEEVERYSPNSVTTIGLVLLSFVLIPYQPTGGTILSVLTITVLVADLFEFEARNVEARNEMTIERPKSALFASTLVLLYAGYYSLFFLIRPFWRLIV
jgi:hypothetical protein